MQAKISLCLNRTTPHVHQLASRPYCQIILINFSHLGLWKVVWFDSEERVEEKAQYVYRSNKENERIMSATPIGMNMTYN